MPHRPFDWLIVGAGYSGAVIAQQLAGPGRKVFLIDRRDHLGGNAYDYLDPAGIRCHAYGPHIFHTNSAEVFSYLSRFTSWRPYEHEVVAWVLGQLVPVPFNFRSLELLFPRRAQLLREKLIATHGVNANVPILRLLSDEDPEVAELARFVYESVFLGYTRKQWNVDPSELSPSVMARVPVRLSNDCRYFQDRFQAMPRGGYEAMFRRIVDDPNITVQLGVDYKNVRIELGSLPTVFSGAIDEFFNYDLGQLPYRSLRFEFQTLPSEFYQPAAQVNYPGIEPYTRITEMKRLNQEGSQSQTTIAFEFPIGHVPGETIPYYPVPREANLVHHKRYLAHAAQYAPNVHFVGRLGEYRYYNMDQAIGAALKFAQRALG